MAIARRRRRVVLALLVAVDLAFVVGLAVVPIVPSLDGLVNVGIALATSWVPVLVLVPAMTRMGARRPEILIVVAALTANAIGDTLYSSTMGDDGYLPSPSVADVGYLAFYVLMLIALGVVIARRSRSLVVGVVLNSAVGALATAAVVISLLWPVLADAVAGGGVAASMINLAYPVLDLMLLVAIGSLIATPEARVTSGWWFLIGGLLVFASADVAYAILDGAGEYIAGSPLDAAWAVGLGLIAWGVYEYSLESPARSMDARGGVSAVVPGAVSVALGLAVLVSGTFRVVPAASVVLATLAVGLATVPMVLQHRTQRRFIEGQERVLGELRAIDDARNQLLVTLNHELRTPLTSIRGYIELAQDGEGGEITVETSRLLEVADTNARRMQSLVDDMLLVSKIDARQVALRLEEVTLDSLVQRVSAAMQPVASAREVELVTEVDPSTPTVRVDPAQFERVLTNLVDNAVKFSRRGGRVEIAVSRRDTTTGRPVALRVSDHGIGIPAADVASIFDRFFRASNAEAGAIRGTGLGLAIAKGLVEAHGGRLRIASVVDEGTVVTVTLPAASSEDSQANSPAPT